ncbi:lactate utilization protein C [Veillonella sp. CHU732]|uniref:LutC/YkgG family protein n=1 Tax=Veillonella sp. CHU732 TaxID=2490949 RepID=UPI000F8EECC1|nr:lactate utilization protein C [Veillonella sp. CHU732]
MDQAKKQAFLGRLSRALGRDSIPTSVTPFDFSKGPQETMYSDLSHEQVVEMFKTEAERLGTKLIEVEESQLAQALVDEIIVRGGGSVVYPKSAEVENYGLEAAFKQLGEDQATFYQWDATKGREANINVAKDSNIGITFPILGIAETATVIQPSTEESGRSLGLLPLTHISILREDTIYPRMTQTMAELAKIYRNDPAKFPTNVVHISGPSNTADIELVRVVGVHGPINVTFILVK